MQCNIYEHYEISTNLNLVIVGVKLLPNLQDVLDLIRRKRSDSGFFDLDK